MEAVFRPAPAANHLPTGFCRRKHEAQGYLMPRGRMKVPTCAHFETGEILSTTRNDAGTSPSSARLAVDPAFLTVGCTRVGLGRIYVARGLDMTLKIVLSYCLHKVDETSTFPVEMIS